MLTRIAVISVLCLLCMGCANQVLPTGGKKDTTPPKLLKADPPMGTLNFKSSIITLKFNKFLQPIDASKIYMTPELSKKIKITQAHKNVIIKLVPPFRDSTTYTIHFNEAIADINEGNKLKDFEYVFSTGPVIDSLKLQGKINDAFTGKPLKDVLVMLYDKTYDSVPYKEKPVYYARSNETGSYTLTHIKAGSYKVFALIDNDGDLKYSQPNEKIGFIDSLVHLKSNVSNVNISLFINKPVKQKLIKSACTAPGTIFLKWALPQPNGLTITCKESNLYFVPTNNTDSLMVYVENTKTDTVKLYMQNNGYLDTVLITMKLPATTGRNKMLLNTKHNLVCDKSGCFFIDTFQLKANHPLVSIDTSRIVFYADTGKLIKRITQVSIINLLTGIISFPITTPSKSNIYTCIIKKGAFKDIYGLTNTDSTKIRFGKMQAEQKGNLLLTLSGLNPASTYVLYVIKDNERIIPFKIAGLKDGKKAYTFKGLIPGTYSAYVLKDDILNGHWDTGDYLNHQQPEKVISYSSSITIRGNWDNELIWEVK